MTIPSVIQGLVETEGGKVFELDSPKGVKWLESVTSFRFEPTGANKPYTVRQETKKGGDYWYAYRKVKGVLHKRYIGATSSLSVPKLEEIAEALNTPQQSRVTETVTKAVTQPVTYKPADDELAALKVQVQALQESLEALREEFLRKHDASDTTEYPSPDTGVTDGELLTELSNLKAENEALRQELADEIQKHITQLTLSRKLRTELETCKQQPATEIELPEAAELLNQLKAKRKKATASLADIEAILEILEGSTPIGGD